MSCDILVIGGGPAGLSAAVNVRARGRSVLVVSNPLEEIPCGRRSGWITIRVCRVSPEQSC